MLHLDFETRSTLDLPDVGLYNYSRHDTTSVWCLAFALDDEEPQLWTPGFPCPRGVDKHVRMDGAVVAHNAAFELAIWNNILVPRYCFPVLKPEQTFCTMAQCYAMGFPGSLENAAVAAGLDIGKDTEGRSLMLQMARPRSRPGKPIVWWDEAEKVHRLYEYCKQDVRVERELGKRLRPLSPSERATWLLDYEINQRGVAVDVESAKAATAMAIKVKKECNTKLAGITGGAVQAATAIAAFKEWLASKGVAADSIAKQAVADMLTDDLPADVAAALILRQESSKASTAKFDRIGQAAGADSRLRNMYQYHGAQTGRWAGRGVQTHNLPRDMPPAEDVERIIELVRAGQSETIDMLYGPPVSVLSKCLRSFFVAPEGKLLVGGDFANVEGRGQAWFSGENWKLDAFRAADNKTGPGIYELAYSRMFNVPVDSVKNPSEERQVGKVCLGADTKVLTDRGILNILDVTTEVKLWDGIAFVTHQGLLRQGIKRTMLLDGVTITPEHKVLSGAGWLPAMTVGSSESALSQALARGSESLPSLEPSGYLPVGLNTSRCSVLAKPRRILFGCITFLKERVHAVRRALLSKLDIGAKTFGRMPTLCQMTMIDDGCLIASPLATIGATIQLTKRTQTTAGAESSSAPNGEIADGLSCNTLLVYPAGMMRLWSWIALTLTRAISQITCALSAKSSIKETDERCKPCKNEYSNWKPVFDLANAGPRNRFTIQTDSGFLVVHNCELAFGYQGGVGSFHVMAKTYSVKVTDEKAYEFKMAWRSAHPRIVRTWAAIQEAAISAVLNPDSTFECGAAGRVAKFRVVESCLWCRLPSGRAICYPYPKILPGDYGPVLTFMTVPSEEDRRKGKVVHDPSNSGNWARMGTYGGSLFNNIVQGFCRDLMVHAMKQVPELVLHTHDELVREVKTEDAAAARASMEQIMRTPPAWAKDFPLYAKCSEMKRYGK